MSAPSSLKSFQQRMAEAVMAPLTRKDSRMRRRHNGVQVDRAVAEFVKPSASLSSHERLEIYNRQYWFRLFGCFEEDFPGVQAILGRARFEDLMRRYLADHPSTSFTLRNLGSRLEAWMTRHRDWLGPRADLALDMARLEWAHVETFDEVAEPLLEDAALAALDESTVLRLQPNLRLLHLHFPVDDLLIEVRNDQGSSASSSNSAQAGRRHRSVRRVLDQPPQELFLAVHRSENTVYYKRIEPEDYRLLRALQTGLALGEALETAFVGSPLPEAERDLFLQEAFRTWRRLGWFAD